MSDDGTLTLKEAAREVGVKPDTLRRWAKTGVIPGVDGGDSFPRPAVATARIVHRLRERGHSLQELRKASQDGRLAYGFLEDLFPSASPAHTLADLSDETGLEEALIERIWQSIGFPRRELENLTEEDLQAVRYIGAVIDSGFPLVAFLQLVRVDGQAMAGMAAAPGVAFLQLVRGSGEAMSRIADAEVRLFHLYVHEPLMRDGVPGLEMAEEMENLARDLLPLASPIMDFLHQRFLQHYVEQDM